MIKYFCDRCGKEMEKGRKMYTGVYDGLGVLIDYIGVPKHLCEECSEKLEAIKDKLKREEDIFNMTDEDIELLHYPFKVGDEVITDDGKVGKIIDICKCDKCKERGFYEPEVEFDDGDTDYISISDKNDGFGSFYKIGSHIFGNLDDSYLLSRIAYLRGELEELELRLNVVRRLKKEGN